MDYIDIVRLNKTLKEAERSAALSRALSERANEAARAAENLVGIARAILDNIRPS